jgi:possible integral membrane protein
MRRSWQLTKGSFWRVVGILLIAALITSALTGIVSTILGAAGGLAAAQENADAYAAIMAGTNFLNSVLQAAILPFSAAVTALTYIDLRMRKEGLDVELRQAAGV